MFFSFSSMPTKTSENKIIPEQYFQVEYEIGRQSVWNKSIPIEIYITPYSNFSKVEVTFNHGAVTDVKYGGPQFFPVNAGETYNVQARAYPKETGTHHITINSIAWEYNTNYTTSTSASIQVDEKLQIIPQTTAFKVLNTLKYIFIIILVLSSIIGIYFLTLKNMGKIKKWLEPDY